MTGSQPNESQLIESLHRIYGDFIKSLQKGNDLSSQVKEWKTISDTFVTLASQGLLDSRTVSLAHAVATGIKYLSSSTISLEVAFQERKNQVVDAIAIELEDLLLDGSSRKRRMGSPERRSKRACRTTEDPTPPSLNDGAYPSPPTSAPSSNKPLPSPPSQSSSSTPSKTEPDHTLVRLWFLQHLSYPYPTNTQKDQLATAAGIVRAKVDSDLTNYRRRAGWTSILNEWCNGDRDAMRRLIDRVEAGKEKRPAVLKAVQGCKDYLTMKEEKTVRNDLLSNIRQASRNPGASKPKDRTASSTSSGSTGTTSSIFSSVSTLADRPATPRSFSNSSMKSDLSEVSRAADVFFPPHSASSTDEEAATLVAGRKRLVSDTAPARPATPPKRLRTAHSHITTPGSGPSSFTHALTAATGTPLGGAQSENGKYTFFLPPTPLHEKPAPVTPEAEDGDSGYRTTASRAQASSEVWSWDTPLPIVASAEDQESGAQAQAEDAPQTQITSWSLPDVWEFQPDLSYGWGAALAHSGSYE